MPSKTCKGCKSVKPLADYYLDRGNKDGHGSRCKLCAHAKQKAYRKATGYDQKRYRASVARERERHLVRKYGVDLERYAALFLKQGGRCAICGKSQARAFDVDHCHGTGRVRGLLCTSCNRMLGHAGDSVATLRAGVAYLAASVGETL